MPVTFHLVERVHPTFKHVPAHFHIFSIVSNDFLITSNAAILAAWSLSVERSANSKPLLGGRYAGEERLGGFSSFPVDFSMDFAPLAFSLSVQTLGGSISLATFIFTFSSLTSKALLSVWLISGVSPSVGNVSVEETFSTDTVSDTNDTIEMKTMFCSRFNLISPPTLTHNVQRTALLKPAWEPDFVLALIP